MINLKRILFGSSLIFCGCLSSFGQVYDPIGNTINNVSYNKRLFKLEDVRLSEGSTFKSRQDINYKYLNEVIEPGRFLHWFLVNADLPAQGGQYGGWESGGSSTAGHYLSALAMMYAATGSQEILDKVNYMIDELDKCQQNDPYRPGGRLANNLGGNGLYVFGWVRQVFNDEIPVNNIVISWDAKRPHDNPNVAANPNIRGFYYFNGAVPWYTSHKIFAGVRDAYYYTGTEKAKQVMIRLADWVYEMTKNLPEDRFQYMLYGETGSMNDVFADTYAVSGDPRHLELSRKFNHQAAMTSCEHKNSSAVRTDFLDAHANNTLAKFLARARQYELTAEQKDHDCIRTFYDYIANDETLVIGGNSFWEGFRQPNRFSPKNYNLKYQNRAAETCNTYNILKIAEKIYEFDGDEDVIEFYERALYNHILPSIHPTNTGAYCYYMPLQPGHFKTYSTATNSNWCCCGTGMENAAKYGKAIYAYENNDVYVNLFIPSELNWEEKGFKVKMEGNIPDTDNITIKIEETDGANRAIFVRYPSWAHLGATVEINGNKQTVSASPGGYIKLERTWAANDIISVTFPLDLWYEALPDDQNLVSIFYGPVLLAGELGKRGLPFSLRVNANHEYCEDEDPIVIPFIDKTATPGELLEKVSDKPLKFTFKQGVGYPAGTSIIPLYDLHDQRQTVYFEKTDIKGYTTPADNSTYYIQWSNSGTYLSFDPETQKVSMMPKQEVGSAIKQTWKIKETGNDYMSFWILDAEDETKCLSIDGNTVANNTGLTVSTLRTIGLDTQKWTLQPNTGGYMIVSLKDVNFGLNRVINSTVTMYNRKMGSSANLRWNFDLKSGTSINTPNAANGNIFNSENRLTVTGNAGKDLLIYDIFGRLVVREEIPADDYSTQLNFEHGIYVVKVGGMTKKIIL